MESIHWKKSINDECLLYTARDIRIKLHNDEVTIAKYVEKRLPTELFKYNLVCIDVA